MLKRTMAEGSKGRVVIMDSITKVTPDDDGAIVLSASHGGASSGEFALEVPLKLVLFNDAGVGKNNAGVAALAMLSARGVAGATISHESGMIGDAQDMWDQGVISHVNDQAAAMGLAAGQNVKARLSALVDRRLGITAALFAAGTAGAVADTVSQVPASGRKPEGAPYGATMPRGPGGTTSYTAQEALAANKNTIGKKVYSNERTPTFPTRWRGF